MEPQQSLGVLRQTSLLWRVLVKFSPGAYDLLQCVHVHVGQSLACHVGLGVAMSPASRRLRVISAPDSRSNWTRGRFGAAAGAFDAAGAFGRCGS